MKLILGLVAAFLALQGCASRSGDNAPLQHDDAEPRVQREGQVTLPPYPQERDLVEFTPGSPSGHRLFVDAASLSMGRDGVVRYTVVMRTSGGATNVTYEGLRCASREKRLYAMGQPDKQWLEAKRSDWEPIRVGRPNEYQDFLYTEYLCPERSILPDRETALRALRRGQPESESRGSHL